jgi:uncharacterized damage-inducible protein DinB
MNWNKTELNAHLQAATQNCLDAAAPVSDAVFFDNSNGKWSIGENLLHLDKSSKRLIGALSLPKEQLANFGFATKPSRTYDVMRDSYIAVLQTGVVAPKGFTVMQTAEDTRPSVIEGYSKTHAFLGEKINQFSEEDLDTYQVPHPIMGNFTLREMLYFTIFHITHHQKAVEHIVKANSADSHWDKASLNEQLQKATDSCLNASTTVSETVFFDNSNGKWSIAENLIHLDKIAKRIAGAFSMPKEQLANLGLATQPSRTYQGMMDSYASLTQVPIVAPKALVAAQTAEDTHASVIDGYKKAHVFLGGTIAHFSENDLNTYQMRHPLFGNLTLREMLYFVIYHIKHHQKAVDRIVKAHA